MVKVSVLTPLKSYTGENLTHITKEGEAPKDFLVKDAIIIALNTEIPNEPLSAADKLLAFHISLRISDKKVGDTLTTFSAEEVVLIKTRAEKALSTVSYGRLLEVIDPKG